jgi:hypothetical protein
VHSKRHAAGETFRSAPVSLGKSFWLKRLVPSPKPDNGWFYAKWQKKSATFLELFRIIQNLAKALAFMKT